MNIPLPRLLFFRGAGVFLSLLPLLLGAQTPIRMEFSHPQMGTMFSIVLYTADEETGRKAAEAAFARIDSLNAHLSDYLPESELNRLCALSGNGQKVPVSEDLWRVMARAQLFSRLSQGAFDVSVGPLTRLWRRAIRRQEMPDPQQITDARARVGWQQIRMYPSEGSMKLMQKEMQLDLGGIGQGFAADEALKVIESFGISQALVDGGGDLMLGDPPPGKKGWEVSLPGIEDAGAPADTTLILSRCGLSTAGDTYRFLESGGIRYSHTLNPLTGMGMTDRRMVTVIAPTCTDADALDTALSVMDPDDGFQLLSLFDGKSSRYAARIVYKAGAEYLKLHSDRWF